MGLDHRSHSLSMCFEIGAGGGVKYAEGESLAIQAGAMARQLRVVVKSGSLFGGSLHVPGVPGGGWRLRVVAAIQSGAVVVEGVEAHHGEINLSTCFFFFII